MRLLPLLCLAATCISAAGQPNFSGAWKLDGTDPPEIYIVEQSQTQLRIVMFVDNAAGRRMLDVKGPIDGQVHSQTVNGAPWFLTARWDGDTLYWETWLNSPDGVLHNWRLMQLSADGKAITARRTRAAPGPEETWTEKWERQDPPVTASHPTAFAAREMVNAPRADRTGMDGALARGALAAAFNDLPQLERELLPLIRENPKAPQAESARTLLEAVYERNGQVRQALKYCDGGRCAFLEKLGSYPEPSVAHRGYASVQAAPGHNGELMLPVSVAAKDAAYQVDTGSNMSLLRLSEASRLGLKLEPVARQITDVTGVDYEAHLAIVPTLSVGAMRLENVPFWVVEDGLLGDVPGLLGIDVLLLFRTIRWNPGGVVEVGFPPQAKNIAQANLYFEGDYPIAEVSSNGQNGLSFYLDTGFNDTHLYVPFAVRFLDLMAAKGRQTNYRIHGQAGHSTLRDVVVPEVAVRIGGLDTTLRDADILLEKAPNTSEWHYGRIGIDVLNQAQTVTLDLQAMQLTLMGQLRKQRGGSTQFRYRLATRFHDLFIELLLVLGVFLALAFLRSRL